MASTATRKIQTRNGEPVLAKHDPIYQRFFESIKTDDLEDALSRSDNKKLIEFLRLLVKPNFKSTRNGEKTAYSIATIAKSCNLTLAELNSFWRDSNLARARDIAFAGIPVVMSDVVTDASNTQVVCPRCDGLGELDTGPDYDTEGREKKRKKSTARTCPECDGLGKVKKSGDIESRKLLFETTGLTGKKGPMIAIQNNSFAPSSLETFVDTFDKMDAVHSGKELPMIEGETEPV